MKKKTLVIIIVIVCILFITLSILIFTDLLFKGKYNVLNSHNKINNIKEEKINTNEDNNTYIYACLPDETDDENIITNLINYTIDKDEIIENIDKCYKYKITCTDINNKEFDCHKSNLEIEGVWNDHPYFTYSVNNKKYIKNFKNNKFVIPPKDYDDIEYIGNYIKVFKGKKLKVYECNSNEYLDYDNLEIIDIKNLQRSTFIILKDKNIKILDLNGNIEYLENVKIDRILYMNDYRFFIQDGNKIKLYDRNGLLWDYGKFDNINNIQFYEIPGANINYETYVFKNKKNIFSLIYNPKTKKGSKN